MFAFFLLFVSSFVFFFVFFYASFTSIIQVFAIFSLYAHCVNACVILF